MMAANRFLISLRVILFLIALLTLPMILLGGSLEDAVGKLASEVNSKMPSGTKASCEFANLSALASEDAARLELSFREALRSWCAVGSGSDVAADIRVTISQNWKEFVCTTQIRTSGGTAIFVETFSRAPRGNGAAAMMPLVLRTEKVWEGPQRILDFTLLKSQDGPEEYWLLTDEGVVLRLVGRTIVSQLQLSRSGPGTRDPMGDLTKQGQDVQVNFSGKICTISSESFRVTECHTAPPEEISGVPGSAPGRNVRQRDSQSPFVEGACPFVRPILASGGGDYAERDFVQLFDSSDLRANSGGTAVSAPIFFMGPVMKISGIGDLGVVVHNLDSESYEAYRAYISCAK